MAIPVSNNDYNTAIGFSALDQLLIGNYNCFVGSKADTSFGHTTGSYNVHIGGTVGANGVDYSDNVIISGDASNISPLPATVSVIGNTVVGNTNNFANTSAPVTIIGYNNNNAGTVGNFSSITNIGANNVLVGNTLINIGNSNNVNFNNCITIGSALTPSVANTIIIGDASHTSVNIGGLSLSSTTGSIFPNLIAGNPGTEGTGINIGGVTYNSVFKASDIGGTNIAQSILHRHSTTWEVIQVNARSNSDTSAHGAVTNGMLISSDYAAGWTGTEYNLFGRASFQASATGTISDTSSPGDFVIATTPDGAVLPVARMRVNSTGNVSLTAGTATANAPIIDASQTWNGAGVFNAFTINITDTSSNFASTLMALNVGGVSKFTVTKFGNVVAAGNISATNALYSGVFNVAALPAASIGARCMVNDSTQTLAAGLGTAVVGGGANVVPVYHDGASWKIG